MVRRVALGSVGVTLLLLVGLVGCGISRSGPSDEGDAAVAGGAASTDSELKKPPLPDSAFTADGLVRDFLSAAVGGGKAGNDQAKAFLNQHALERWREAANPENPPMTIIRLLHPLTAGAVTGDRTPVIVDYQVVGYLSDSGRVDDVLEPTVLSMTFHVVPDASNLRIDEITNYPQPGLMLSDEALNSYYRLQPIYFWGDTSYRSLVPDLRYVSLTDPADVRAGRLVRSLVAGPSAWNSTLQPVRGVAGGDVLSEDGGLTVKFTADGPALDSDGLRRLLLQVQWTLHSPSSGSANSPSVRLVIDGKTQDVSPSPDSRDFLAANRTSNFEAPAQRYDITEGKVVSSSGGTSPQGALAAAENQSVAYAAVARGGAVAAFVRAEGNGRRSLRIVRDGVVVETGLKGFADMGRPVFVPDSNDSLLIVYGGRLYAVSAVDGAVNDVTRGGGQVTSVSVSSDGRRVAFVANEQAYVTSLGVVNNNILVGSNPRPLLTGQAAHAITWLSESWLAVANPPSVAGASVLWRVTADGVVAQNLSESLKGVIVTDLVAYPAYPPRNSVDLLAFTPQGVYSLTSSLAPESAVRAPFFGS